MRWASDQGATVEIVALSDGENSHAASREITPGQLVRRRAQERLAALGRLDLSSVPIHRLGLPNASVERHPDAIESLLERLARDGTVLVAPPPDDGHPDHDAAGRATLRVAVRTGSACWFTPIWSRVRQRAQSPTAVLALNGLRATKQFAAECFTSQLMPLGPRPEDGPVVHPAEALALLSSTEQIIEAVA